MTISKKTKLGMGRGGGGGALWYPPLGETLHEDVIEGSVRNMIIFMQASYYLFTSPALHLEPYENTEDLTTATGSLYKTS